MKIIRKKFRTETTSKLYFFRIPRRRAKVVLQSLVVPIYSHVFVFRFPNFFPVADLRPRVALAILSHMWRLRNSPLFEISKNHFWCLRKRTTNFFLYEKNQKINSSCLKEWAMFFHIKTKTYIRCSQYGPFFPISKNIKLSDIREPDHSLKTEKIAIVQPISFFLRYSPFMENIKNN